MLLPNIEAKPNPSPPPNADIIGAVVIFWERGRRVRNPTQIVLKISEAQWETVVDDNQ